MGGDRMGFDLLNKYGRMNIVNKRMFIYVDGWYQAIKLICLDTTRLKIFLPKWK